MGRLVALFALLLSVPRLDNSALAAGVGHGIADSAHHGDGAHHGHGHGHHGHGHGHHHDEHDHGHEDGGGHGHAHGHAGARDKADKSDGLQYRWMMAYASALGMSALSFVGVCLLLLLNIPTLSAIVEYSALAFAGTVLVADALVHLIPHALEGADHGEMTKVGLCAVAGCMALLAVPEALQGCGSGSSGHSHGNAHGHSLGGEVQAYGYANLVTEMLHNFVDGITLGLSWMAGTSAGLGATLAVAVHELPQELGDFMVLRSAGFPTGRLLMWNFVVSLTCVAGVGLVHAMGETASTAQVQKYMTAFTAGTFLSLSLNMIFPQVTASIKSRHGSSPRGMALAKLFCCALGVVAVAILVKVGELEAHDHDHDSAHSGHGHAHGAGHGHSHVHSHAEL